MSQDPSSMYLSVIISGNQAFEIPLHLYVSSAAAAKSLQSCPPLCDPMDYNPPGSSIHGNLQARVLEWGAIAFSKWNTTQP